MTTNKLKQFKVEAEIRCWLEIPLSAESWEDALARAKNLSPTDFIRAKGEVLDQTIRLGAVRSSSVPELYADD